MTMLATITHRANNPPWGGKSSAYRSHTHSTFCRAANEAMCDYIGSKNIIEKKWSSTYGYLSAVLLEQVIKNRNWARGESNVATLLHLSAAGICGAKTWFYLTVSCIYSAGSPLCPKIPPKSLIFIALEVRYFGMVMRSMQCLAWLQQDTTDLLSI